jgi:hypothetical protein
LVSDITARDGKIVNLFYSVGTRSLDKKKTKRTKTMVWHVVFVLPNLLVLEIIDHVFAKTSQNARFLLSENERFGIVFVKTGSINSGIGVGGLC